MTPHAPRKCAACAPSAPHALHAAQPSGRGACGALSGRLPRLRQTRCMQGMRRMHTFLLMGTIFSFSVAKRCRRHWPGYPYITVGDDEQAGYQIPTTRVERFSVDEFVPGQWYAQLDVGVVPEMDAWTETIVAGDGNTLACTMKRGAAMFAPTGFRTPCSCGWPAQAPLPSRTSNGSSSSKEVGLTYLLSDPGWELFSELLATGEAVAPGVDVRSDAAQFPLAWPLVPKLRHVAWALHMHGVTGLRWPGDREFAREAGVSCQTDDRYIDRAFAVGLPVPSGLVDNWWFPWTTARRECYRRLVEAGHLAGGLKRWCR